MLLKKLNDYDMEKIEIINDEHEFERVYNKIDEIFSSQISSENIAHFTQFIDYLVRLKSKYSLFNTMLVFTQNPSVRFFGSRSFWKRLHRFVKKDARAYVILAPNGPVSFVYDIGDTVGNSNMDEILCEFERKTPKGRIDKEIFERIKANLKSCDIEIKFANLPVNLHGYASNENKKLGIYLNQNKDDETIFVALMHEIAHILLGHLGEFELKFLRNKKILKYKIKARIGLNRNLMEFEAESVAYMLCHHYGLISSSASYLSLYVNKDMKIQTSLIIKVAEFIEIFFVNHKDEPKKEKNAI